jgi:DNA-binding NarL/FixJ family response regulator
MSSYCKSLGRVHTVKHYGLAENIADTFEGEASATDGRYPPDRIVQFRMDFHEGWLQQQSPKDKEIIRELAMGSTQSEVARKFGVTPACINQYQKRYRASWNAYIADKKEAAKKAA